MGSYIISIIAILISLGSLYISFSMNKRSIELMYKPPLYNWQTDYFYDMHESGVLLKWVRLINNSAQPISIYEVLIKNENSEILWSHQQLSIDKKFICDELTSDTNVTSNLLKPVLTLQPYTALEGYLYFIGMYLKLNNLINEDQEYSLVLKTSRKPVEFKIKLDFTQRDI